MSESNRPVFTAEDFALGIAPRPGLCAEQANARVAPLVEALERLAGVHLTFDADAAVDDVLTAFRALRGGK